MKIRRLFFALGVSVALIGTAVLPANATTYTSYDAHWSGLVNRSASFMAVTGNLTVPRVTTAAGTNSFGAAFIALGGYGSLPFAQVGFSFSPTGYGVFTETFDAAGHESLGSIPLVIRAGDKLALGLAFTVNRTVLEFRVHNLTTGQVLNKLVRNARPFLNGASAEWIVERPNSRVLAPFGTLVISNAKEQRTTGVWYPANYGQTVGVVLLGAGGHTLSKLTAASGYNVSVTWRAAS